jgi:hypothetical protein
MTRPRENVVRRREGRRLAREVKPRPSHRHPSSGREQATVVGLLVGPPSTVTIRRGDDPATDIDGVRHFNGYAPTLGDSVWFFWNGDDPIVEDKLAP